MYSKDNAEGTGGGQWINPEVKFYFSDDIEKITFESK